MRFRRLLLLRYGHLTDVALDFPPDAPLCVVAGANEAGKSTALAAISDALFGFGHRSDFDFLHGAPNLRVGITLTVQDGAEGTFIRRKGRRDTLRDAGDSAVPEASLARFLGGVGRDQFEGRFGLNGARLREGAKDLLAAGGEAGESMLAGMGLLHLRAALTALEEEAKGLVGDGRGRRRLSAAVEAWRAAQSAADAAAVKPQDWENAAEEHSRIAGRLKDLRDKAQSLVRDAARLERFRRLRSPLAELDAARAELATLREVPRLPADAEATMRRAADERRLAQRDAEREAAEAHRLTGVRTTLAPDHRILALQYDIDALGERSQIVRQAAADLPSVAATITGWRAAVVEAARDLGIAEPPDALRDRVPSEGTRTRVQSAMNRRAALATRRDETAAALDRASRRRDAAAASLEALPVPVSPVPLRRAIDAVRAEGPLDLEMAKAERVLADASRAAAAAVAALPLWHGDANALAACPIPLPAETEALAAQLQAAADAATEARRHRTDIEDDLRAQDDQIAVLARGETIATREAVTDARRKRDRAWRLIRRGLEGGASPSAAEREGLPAGALPAAFESLRDEADILADRRADDAERVAAFQLALARLSLLRSQRTEAEAALAAALSALATADTAWQAVWAPAGIVPASPAAMLEWRRDRSEALRLCEAEDLARQRRDDIAARRDQARATLLTVLAGHPAEQDLTPLLAAADTACASAEAALADHQRALDRLRQEEERLPDLNDAAMTAAAAWVATEADWAAAVVALGLDPSVSDDEVAAALRAWARIAEAAEAWRSDERRIDQMEIEISRFASAMDVVWTRLQEPRPDGPAHLAFSGLMARLATARTADGDAEALAVRIAAHEAAAADAAHRQAAAANDVAALQVMARADDELGLEDAIRLARRRDELVVIIGRLERQILDQGDGLDEAVLRTEAVGIDAHAATLRLREIADEQALSNDEASRLGAAQAAVEARLEEMQAGRDAAAHAQEAENALADARDAAMRFARVHLARVMLRAGVDRFRAEQQGPLLRAAGGHFALLTGGRYARLGVDGDASGRVILLAVRDNGSECPVEGLSEGTRDQLYLALRVAAVEAHASHAEPLPFIADDLLVHFDDRRADAALSLLSTLGRTTQVVLFTHHDHIVELAKRHSGVAVLAMPEATVSAGTAR
jgi:uncharacterized protein YhaN